MSVADWETQKPQRGIAHVCDVLRDVAESLPRLKMLDLRTRSFDVIDHTLAFASVGVKYVNIEALCSVMPFFSHLRVLRLPLLINHEAEFSLSRAIASAAPTLEMVSWMYEVHLKAETDEYNVVRSRGGSIDIISRLTGAYDATAAEAIGTPLTNEMGQTSTPQATTMSHAFSVLCRLIRTSQDLISLPKAVIY
ncbi:hypothetical protein FRB95_001906 [Tulasnella sp. JGI-2019a]|nr:hypothetical protein FRB95_001906 [Tulasnella sp. JGI-2019a]